MVVFQLNLSNCLSIRVNHRVNETSQIFTWDVIKCRANHPSDPSLWRMFPSCTLEKEAAQQLQAGPWAAFSWLLQAAGLQLPVLWLWPAVAGRAAEEIRRAGQHPDSCHLRGSPGPARPLHRHPDRPGVQLWWARSNPSIGHTQPLELGFALEIASSIPSPPSPLCWHPDFSLLHCWNGKIPSGLQEEGDAPRGVGGSSVLAGGCCLGFLHRLGLVKNLLQQGLNWEPGEIPHIRLNRRGALGELQRLETQLEAWGRAQ